MTITFSLIDSEFKKEIIKILKKLRMTIERNADYCKRKLETIRRSQEKLQNSFTETKPELKVMKS